MTKLKAVILAAGKGTRLRSEGSDLPKVMRNALGKPLLYYVLKAVDFIEPEDITIVVGYKKEKITECFGGYNYVVQEEQRGTGHAVMAARSVMEGEFPVLICYGDMPLISRDTYNSLINTHIEQENACTILTGTSELDLPYGRIIRDVDGGFLEVVEERDCTESQRRIRELNIGVYVFDSTALLGALNELRCDNAQGEYYLTDVPAILRGKNAKIGICKRDMGPEIIGVNTVEQLQQVEKVLKQQGGGGGDSSVAPR